VASIDWGDGETSSALVSTYADGFVVYGSHSYAQGGTYQAKATILEGNNDPVTVTTSVLVKEKSPTGTPAGGGPVGSPIPPVTIPKLVSAKSVQDKRGVVRLVLTFSGTMDGKATDVSRYTVTDPGKDGKLGTKDDRIVRLGSAKLDAKLHTVTLTAKGAFSRRSPYRVAIRGGDSTTLRALATK
jgi:hypothetical protein